MDILIVDGYNVIHDWEDIRSGADLSAARDRLVERLSDYQGYRGGTVIIVFDAHLTREPEVSIEDYGGVRVIYTREGLSADQYIEWLVREELRDEPLTVATSDGLQQVMVMREGVLRMSAVELGRLVTAARREREQDFMQPPVTGPNRVDGSLRGEAREKLERLRRADSLD